MSVIASISPAPLTEREEDAQRRLDFAAFAQQCFRELNPLTPLAMNWHVEVIAAKLAAVYRGEIPRLIINVPPRYLKSLWGRPGTTGRQHGQGGVVLQLRAERTAGQVRPRRAE